jgi:hypothetical protein
MEKTNKNLKVVNILDVYKGMSISTECVVAKNLSEASRIFSEMADITIATIDTAYYEHASSGKTDARISFEGTDEEIWAEDVETDKTYVVTI